MEEAKYPHKVLMNHFGNFKFILRYMPSMQDKLHKPGILHITCWNWWKMKIGALIHKGLRILKQEQQNSKLSIRYLSAWSPGDCTGHRFTEQAFFYIPNFQDSINRMNSFIQCVFINFLSPNCCDRNTQKKITSVIKWLHKYFIAVC